MINIKKIPVSDRPRERLLNYGSESLSNEELISIILKTGCKNRSVKEVALSLLEEIGDINKLSEMEVNSLKNIKGVGKVKAIELKAAIELGKRVYYAPPDINDTIFDNPLAVYNYFYSFFSLKKQEYFYCIYLDIHKKMIAKKLLFVGTLNMSLVSTREIFKEAYLLSASGIICVHNHPGGDSSPSKADELITKKIKELSGIHEITLVDHVIIGYKNYFSFNEQKKFSLF